MPPAAFLSCGPGSPLFLIYFPVFTYDTHAPWFLNDVPLARTSVCHPPFLQASLSRAMLPKASKLTVATDPSVNSILSPSSWPVNPLAHPLPVCTLK